MTDESSPGLGLVFTPEQVQRVEALLATLGPEQALWLSGYLAARGLPSTGGAADVSAARERPVSDDGLELTVLYGTETGNAQRVAERLVERASVRGIDARARDMGDFRTKELRTVEHVALISATHGEGDPPEPARGFFEFLRSRKAPTLEGASFAVLSLGDSSYVEFCEAGKELDRRFEELGAQRLLDRVDCDVDYHDRADAWVDRLLEALAAQAGAVANEEAARARPRDPGTTTEYSRADPYRAEILDATPLVGIHSDKETLHVELAVEEDALPFEPGDSLGVAAENEEAVLEAVLHALGASTSASVRIGDNERLLGDALKYDLELTRVTPGFLQAYAEVAASAELKALLQRSDREELTRFLKCHQVPDVLARYPVPGLEPQLFTGMLRRLQPRLYSIASSRKWIPDQVDLTVAPTRWTDDGKRRNGVASTFLADRRRPGETVDVFVDRNSRFRLPADPDAPVIMVGAGTGVAPYRAFMQERAETGARGRNWLFFGDRRFREDFLYQTEWQRFLADGILTRMDVAFSRDRAEKVYVQHRLRERARDVWAWLEEGAHAYVCGDAAGMAPGVEEALLAIVRDVGGRSAEEAGEYLQALKKDRRYQRDVY